MKRLLAQQPNDPILLQRIGDAYNKEGKFAEAAASYEQVIKLNPHLVATTVKLAQLYAGPLKEPDQGDEPGKGSARAGTGRHKNQCASGYRRLSGWQLRLGL